MSQNAQNSFSMSSSPFTVQPSSSPGFHSNMFYQPSTPSSRSMLPPDSPFSPRSNVNTMIQFNAQQFNQFPQSPLHTPKKTPVKPNLGTAEQSAGFDMKFYDELLSSQIFLSPSLSQSQSKEPSIMALYELQGICLRGCDSASKVIEGHAKRAFFKKIDLLCDRLKSDLCNTDKAVVNINSHGIGWAIKDFVFVFTRISSAWVILRDYFYSKSDGMQCVNEFIDPNFSENFIEWQTATGKMVESLRQSFESLNARDQRNGNRKTHSNHGTPSSRHPNNINDFENSMFDPLVAENSEQAQMNMGEYLKSATYKPIEVTERKERLVRPLYQRGAENLTPTRSVEKSQYRMNTPVREQHNGWGHELDGAHSIIPDAGEVDESTKQQFYDSLLGQLNDASVEKLIRMMSDQFIQ